MSKNNTSISNEILVMIQHELQQLPVTQQCTICKIYNNEYVDVKFNNGSVLTYVKCVGTPIIGAEGVLLFLENNFNKPLLITQTSIDKTVLEEIVTDLIEDESIDLTGYVKKSDVGLKFSLEENGTMIIGLNIGEGY